jgi:hypothetical protein
VNRRTIALAQRFAMSRLTGDEAWTVAGTYGSVLAHLELGNWNAAAWNYAQARRYLRAMIRRGSYQPLTKVGAS